MEYAFLGKPLDNATLAAKIETGSYVGTGTYGADNPCSLTFDFTPKFVMVCGKSTAGSYNSQYQLFYCFGMTTQITHYYERETVDTNIVSINISENTLSWYAGDSSSSQLNNETVQYQYIAIGQ